MAKQKHKAPSGPPDALAAFARIFWDEAIRQVEQEIEAEETATKKPGRAGRVQSERAP